MSWYITLLACGLFLIGIEIFVPGGILGALGSAALVGAVVIGFNIFPPWLGWISLFAILALAGSAVFVWMKFLPQSPVGRALSLAQNLGVTEPPPARWQAGMKGTTLSTLRPAGKAEIDGKRADVIAADGTWIEQGAAIEVVRVAGSHIYVREILN
jgi:membrane-bound serine protease (ClpP class)